MNPIQLPSDVLRTISSFTPRCVHCNQPWAEVESYKMEYYFTEDVPDAWMCGSFTPKDPFCQKLNALPFDLRDAYPMEEFMRVFKADELSSRFGYSKHFDVELFDYGIDKFTVDYRGVCEMCEHELNFLTGALLLGFVEKKSMTFTSPGVDGFNPGLVRIKNVFYQDTLNYCVFKSQNFFYYDDDLCMEEIFSKCPECELERDETPENELYDEDGDVIDQLEDGYGFRFFPSMYIAYEKSFIEWGDDSSSEEEPDPESDCSMDTEY